MKKLLVAAALSFAFASFAADPPKASEKVADKKKAAATETKAPATEVKTEAKTEAKAADAKATEAKTEGKTEGKTETKTTETKPAAPAAKPAPKM
jgi:hypothetical protein